MINQLKIKNYRSIKELDMTPTEMNALVGPNNVGKSNILRALNLVLGAKWPPYAVDEEDKNRDSPEDSIRILVGFDSPLTKDYYGTKYSVWGIDFMYNSPDDNEFACLDKDHNRILVGGYRNVLKVDNKLRENTPTLLVDTRRDLMSELRASQWTILGKILKTLEQKLIGTEGFPDEFDGKAKELASRIREKPVEALEDLLNTEMSGVSGFHDLELSFEPPDLYAILRAIQIHVRESPDLPKGRAEELGQGLQSAMVIALARAYQTLHQVNPVLLLEEPEAFLHPQARRAFHSLLQNTAQSKGCQVFYSTHSTEFIDMTRSERIFLTRKDATAGTSVIRGDPSILTPDEQSELKIICEADQRMREILFSNCVIACEGDSEAYSLPILLSKAGQDSDRNGWTLLSAGSKSNLPFILKVCSHFKIPCVAVFDDDSDKSDYAQVHEPMNKKIISMVGGLDKCVISSASFEISAGIKQTSGSKRRSAVKWAREQSTTNAEKSTKGLIQAVKVATS
jgi:energy-coupling factor transporter ATP-binding protein EcfA2